MSIRVARHYGKQRLVGVELVDNDELGRLPHVGALDELERPLASIGPRFLFGPEVFRDPVNVLDLHSVKLGHACSRLPADLSVRQTTH